MEPLRFKRPATQTNGQITQTTFGNSQPVPKAYAARPSLSHLDMEGMNGRLRPRPHATTPPRRQMLMTSMQPLPVAQPTAPDPIAAPQTMPRPRRPLTIDMSLPGEESPLRLRTMYQNAKWAHVRHWAFRGMALAMILVITMGGLLFSQGYLKANKVFKGGAGTAEALKPTVNPDLLKGEGSGRVNILLLGRGGGTHQAPDLTDTLMLASIDPVNHTASLVSLPRDLWVTVPNHGVMKLNAAWQTGVFKYLGKNTTGTTDPKAIAAGFELVDQTIQDVLGLEINYNVIVNFQAFQQAIDTVGGVNISVPADLVDPTMAWENNNDPVLARAGPQAFDGKHALIYVRSRETSSDFARAERQRTMLVALKSKVVSLGTLSNPVKISGLLSAFGNNVQTDLSLKNAQRLYNLTKDISDAHTTSLGLADPAKPLVTTGNINGQSVVLPKAGLFNYNDIRQFIRNQLTDPYLIREHAKVLVLNGTMLPGLATTKGEELKTYGYNISGMGNTPNSGWTQTALVDLSHGKSKYTKHYLEQRLGLTATTKLPDSMIQTNGVEFVIILGSDQTATTHP